MKKAQMTDPQGVVHVKPADPEKARADHRSPPQAPQPGGDAVMSGDVNGPTQDGGQEKLCSKCGGPLEPGRMVLCVAADPSDVG